VQRIMVRTPRNRNIQPVCYSYLNAIFETHVSVFMSYQLHVGTPCAYRPTRMACAAVDICNTWVKAVPWLRRLVAGLPPPRPGFDPGSVHVGFVVDKVALGQVFPRVLRFSPVNLIPPGLRYLGKWKIWSSFSSSQDCTISLMAAVRP
jgi:hypothetical protein